MDNQITPPRPPLMLSELAHWLDAQLAIEGDMPVLDFDAGGGFTASPAVVDGRIILGNTDGTLYCFGPKEKAKN